MLKANNLPDCGNLRSTKRRDVKLRLNCMKAMLKKITDSNAVPTKL